LRKGYHGPGWSLLTHRRERRVQLLSRCLQQYLAFVIQRVANVLLLGCRLRQRVLCRGVQAVHLCPFGLQLLALAL